MLLQRPSPALAACPAEPLRQPVEGVCSHVVVGLPVLGATCQAVFRETVKAGGHAVCKASDP